MTKKSIIWIVFLAIFAWVLLYVSWVFSLVPFVIYLIIYGCIAFVLVFVYRKIRGRALPKYKEFFIKFLSGSGYSLAIIIWLVWSFCYYQNEISPAKMPSYWLINGEKIILFQWMSHIASPSFYSQVQSNIQWWKTEGAVLFFEGVRPGTEENAKKFNKLIGVEFDADIYKNFSKLYGLVPQKNEDFLWLANNKDFNVDLSIDEVMSIYETRFPDTDYDAKEAIDISGQVAMLLENLKPRELSVLVYFNQAIVNTIIKSEGIRTWLLEISGNTNIFDIILDDRNSHVVSELESSSEEFIIVLYGLMHFEGIYEELRKNDPSWRIDSIDYIPVIQ